MSLRAAAGPCATVADLRQLAGGIAAFDGLPAEARALLDRGLGDTGLAPSAPWRARVKEASSTSLRAGMTPDWKASMYPAYSPVQMRARISRVSDMQICSARWVTLVMRTVNRRVPGAVFLLLFLGSLAFPAASFLVVPQARDGSGTALVGAAAVCALVGHLITAGGNVPLNNALESSRGRGNEPAARQAFEGRWNALHGVRTLFAVAAFALVAVVP